MNMRVHVNIVWSLAKQLWVYAQSKRIRHIYTLHTHKTTQAVHVLADYFRAAFVRLPTAHATGSIGMVKYATYLIA